MDKVKESLDWLIDILENVVDVVVAIVNFVRQCIDLLRLDIFENLNLESFIDFFHGMNISKLYTTVN